MNAFEGVGSLIVAGRIALGRDVLERQAAVIVGASATHNADLGEADEEAKGRLPERDGVALCRDGSGRVLRKIEYHPDPNVERVRWAHTNGELEQALGRGRAARRTADVNGGVTTCQWGGAKVGHLVARLGA
ncbi:hypothetical protein [Tateyamaria pelophila]|uniref:hypothetical protein n=1 Tax=Tateyamaria pelophila TaxID=328415 RepID=UPI001CC15F2C|nr:hypothetical protein [Tateyamaria pelophila]